MITNVKLKLLAPIQIEQRRGTATWYAQLVSGVSVIVWAIDTIVKAVTIV